MKGFRTSCSFSSPELFLSQGSPISCIPRRSGTSPATGISTRQCWRSCTAPSIGGASRPFVAAIPMTLGALVKPTGALGLPALWRPFQVGLPLIVLAMATLSYLPFAAAGTAVIGFLPRYLEEQGLTNGEGVFWLVLRLVPSRRRWRSGRLPRRGPDWPDRASEGRCPQTKEVRVCETLPRLPRDRQSLVDQRQGDFSASRFGLELGKQSVMRWCAHSIPFADVFLQRLPSPMAPDLWVAQAARALNSSGSGLSQRTA
jgi:hypothetical protein